MSERESLTVPDLTADHIIVPNAYRIGDSVALVELRAFIEERYGKKDWYYNPSIQEGDYLRAVARLASQEWYTIDAAPESAVVFDDVNLWLWNGHFANVGHYVPFTNIPATDMDVDLIFAPLLEAGYSVERCLSIRVACNIAKYLYGEYGTHAVTLLPPDANRCDVEDLQATGLPIMMLPSIGAVAGQIARSKFFIGCDTGISHIAGKLPGVKQIALHSRSNTQRHNELVFDHQKQGRSYIRKVLGEEKPHDILLPQYRSIPNKPGIEALMFDRNGYSLSPDGLMALVVSMTDNYQ